MHTDIMYLIWIFDIGNDSIMSWKLESKKLLNFKNGVLHETYFKSYQPHNSFSLQIIYNFKWIIFHSFFNQTLFIVYTCVSPCPTIPATWQCHLCDLLLLRPYLCSPPSLSLTHVPIPSRNSPNNAIFSLILNPSSSIPTPSLFLVLFMQHHTTTQTHTLSQRWQSYNK